MIAWNKQVTGETEDEARVRLASYDMPFGNEAIYR